MTAAIDAAAPAHARQPLKVELRGVGKVFEARGVSRRALRPIDLALERGHFMALVGPSGCGKSTVLNLVAGLMQPSEGQVLYDTRPVNGPNRRVGYMTQKDTLLPWRTVEDNIGVALELRCRPVSRSERRDRVADAMQMVGLSGFARNYPSELSGGMRKRAALARLMIYEPETLLMDEPFGALDAQLKLVMQNELLRLTRARNMTVLFVTHDLAEAIALADDVAVFTGRPGAVQLVRRIPLAQPRDVMQVRFQPEFGVLHEELWTLLKDEAIEASRS